MFISNYDFIVPRQQMFFHQLDQISQIEFTRREFVSLVKRVFESPEIMKQMLLEKRLSNEQAKQILAALDNLSQGACYCCKRFDQYRLHLKPIEPILEPLLEIARQNVKAKLY
jgi:hypothetical protein